jgi:hypothetical protein
MAEARTLFPGGVNSPVRAFRSVGGNPIVFDRVKGPYCWDVDGNKYVDYIGSWGPAIVGAANDEVNEVLRAQLEKGTSFGAPGPLEVRRGGARRGAEGRRAAGVGRGPCKEVRGTARGPEGWPLKNQFMRRHLTRPRWCLLQPRGGAAQQCGGPLLNRPVWGRCAPGYHSCVSQVTTPNQQVGTPRDTHRCPA